MEVDGILEDSSIDRTRSGKIPSAVVFRRSDGDMDMSLSASGSEMETWFGARREFGVTASAGTAEVCIEMEGCERRHTESKRS